MKDNIDLSGLLTGLGSEAPSQLGVFAFLGLGVVESLATGALSASDAVRVLFNSQNCQYVHKKLRDEVADKIMSHGVQLADLFEALPEQVAQQEFQRELEKIRSLCLQLLELHRAAA